MKTNSAAWSFVVSHQDRIIRKVDLALPKTQLNERLGSGIGIRNSRFDGGFHETPWPTKRICFDGRGVECLPDRNVSVRHADIHDPISTGLGTGRTPRASTSPGIAPICILSAGDRSQKWNESFLLVPERNRVWINSGPAFPRSAGVPLWF